MAPGGGAGAVPTTGVARAVATTADPPTMTTIDEA